MSHLVYVCCLITRSVYTKFRVKCCATGKPSQRLSFQFSTISNHTRAKFYGGSATIATYIMCPKFYKVLKGKGVPRQAKVAQGVPVG
jgi:hypothetical protein